MQNLGTHSSAPGTCWAETYNYDAWGNLYSFGPNSTTQSAYIGCSQESGLSSSATTKNQLSTYTYDTAGNLITIPGVANYTYDAENHLVSAGGLNYSYDGDGKRVMKSTGRIYWYGAGSDPLLETDSAGNQLDRHYYFNGMRVARQEGWAQGFWIDHYVNDALGNARFVYGYNGAYDVSDYYPFGGEHPYHSQEGNVFKFTGKERDGESGLDDFDRRYFGSTFGRFLSPDNSSGPDNEDAPQSLNLYSYVQNNPTNATDPDGHDCVFVQGNIAYVQRGDCSGIANGTYVAGEVKEKSGSYDPNTHTLSFQFEPYWTGVDNAPSLSFVSIGNVTPTHPGQTEFEKFASRIAVGADNVNAFVLQVGVQVGAGVAGRAIGAGIESVLASRAASPALKVVINWAHRVQDIRPGHLPPPGTQAEIQQAVEGAVQAGKYTTSSNGVISGTTEIHGVEVGFRGKIVGGDMRISTVFAKR